VEGLPGRGREAAALYTSDEYRSAFESAGLVAELDPVGLMGRGLWVAQRAE
jgi:hypothetical protein